MSGIAIFPLGSSAYSERAFKAHAAKHPAMAAEQLAPSLTDFR
jgi:hypothetical protein